MLYCAMVFSFFFFLFYVMQIGSRMGRADVRCRKGGRRQHLCIIFFFSFFLSLILILTTIQKFNMACDRVLFHSG